MKFNNRIKAKILSFWESLRLPVRTDNSFFMLNLSLISFNDHFQDWFSLTWRRNIWSQTIYVYSSNTLLLGANKIIDWHVFSL